MLAIFVVNIALVKVQKVVVPTCVDVPEEIWMMNQK